MFEMVLNEIFDLCHQKNIKIVTAESCTGGLIAHAITARAGASAVFERGFVTYSNEAKHEALGVPADIIDEHGAVSPETALAMASGAIKHSHAQVAISITGVAGPDGGSEEKPVGLVHFGVAAKGKVSKTEYHIFDGSRSSIQNQAATQALTLLLNMIKTL